MPRVVVGCYSTPTRNPLYIARDRAASRHTPGRPPWSASGNTTLPSIGLVLAAENAVMLASAKRKPPKQSAKSASGRPTYVPTSSHPHPQEKERLQWVCAARYQSRELIDGVRRRYRNLHDYKQLLRMRSLLAEATMAHETRTR